MSDMIQQDFTPEKQEQAKKAYQIGQNLIYKKQVFDSVMASIESDPVSGLAEAVVMVLLKIDEGMGRMPYDVALAAALMLFDDVADAINQTGRAQYGEQELEQALSEAVQMYLGNYGEDNDVEGLQQVAMMGQEQPQQQPQQPQGGGLLSQAGGV